MIRFLVVFILYTCKKGNPGVRGELTGKEKKKKRKGGYRQQGVLSREQMPGFPDHPARNKFFQKKIF
jgi:hypothetical protein